LASTTLRSARGDGPPTLQTSRDQAASGRLGVTQGDARTPATATAAMTRDAATQSRADRRRTETAFGTGGEGSREIELGTRGEIRVLADDVKNALVVLAKPRDYRLVETALRKLDIVPLQVLIEATILEVQLNDNLRYGVEWYFKYGDSKAAFSRQGTRESPLAPPFGRLARDVVTASLPGFSYFFQSSGVNVVVNALNAVSDVNVVSSPQLFVLDNQTGTLQVGDQVPITTQSSVSTLNPDAPIVNSVEYRDTGVILSVTPRVNASGLVSLDVIQEVSDAVPTTTSDISSPTIQQRRIESTVAVQSGETVALGGLIRDRRIDANQGVPYLSKIPVLGWLFGVSDEAASRTELLVLITPRVVSSADEARRITDDLRQRLRRITPLEQRIR
jgi:general secretion pathway protein D